MPGLDSLRDVAKFCTIPTQFIVVVLKYRNQPYVQVVLGVQYLYHLAPNYLISTLHTLYHSTQRMVEHLDDLFVSSSPLCFTLMYE